MVLVEESGIARDYTDARLALFLHISVAGARCSGQGRIGDSESCCRINHFLCVGHVMPDMQNTAADGIDEALG